ncbi:zinc transport system ATP-binding protein [Pillotina sp. SPG140]|jgi:zinc transport system ATP-binding protein
MGNTDNILLCQNVSLGYDGHIVVRALDFSVRAGDYLCIVGENGCGKSTIIKGILKLIPPLHGSIQIDPTVKKSDIGYLSQQVVAKNDFPAGVFEIVLSGVIGTMGLRPFYSRKEKQRAEEAMRQLLISDLKSRCYRELSGGQQRRVLIARALCASQKLLVLDEPAAGLDPVVTAEMYELLRTLNKEQGITLIMVSHDIHAAETYANRILHIQNKGEAYFFGTPAEYAQSHYGKAFVLKKEEHDERSY